MKKICSFSKKIDEKSLICLCPMRNESHLIKLFLDHYQKMGVTHFVFFDNISTDNSIEIVQDLSTAYNIQAYICGDSFLESKWGSKWATQFMDMYCINKWCITVDVDEFLTPPDNKKITDLIDDMIEDEKKCCKTVLVDMYPNKLSTESAGETSLNESCFFDKFNEDFYYLGFNEYGEKYVQGGLRKRLYDSDNMLSKNSLFYYRFSDTHFISGGWHWLNPHCAFSNYYPQNISFEPISSSQRMYNKKSHLNFIKINSEIVRSTDYFTALLHYKFVRQDIYTFFQERIERNQDWDNSAEYKKYLENTKKNFLDKKYTVDCSVDKNLIYEQLVDLL